MEVKFNLNLNEKAQVEAFVNFLQTVADTAETAGKALQEKPKTSRRKTAPKTTEQKSEDRPEEVKVDAAEEPKQETKQEAANKPTISATDIKAEAAAKIKAGHREDIKAKLTDLGVKNVSSLAEQEYAGFMDFLKGL